MELDMAIPFNADEVFEIAEQIEQNGAAFYRRASTLVKDSGTRELLLELAAMEDQHLATFQSMRVTLSKHEWKPVFDPDGQAEMYLRAIADGEIFNVKEDPAAVLSGSETPQQMVRLAIEREKDSVIFYQELREVIPPKLGKDRLDRIIGEELRHIMILNEELRKR